MKKRVFISSIFAIFFVTAAPAWATNINFEIATYNFAYNATYGPNLHLWNADYSRHAFISFTRGEVPADPITYNPVNGEVVVIYSIDEFSNIQDLLKYSSSVFFDYMDYGDGNESAYLYSNP
ncbi:MAG: hypothetical protein MJA83_13440 [Gammaproteobacteria bacterium]|nr:hypothetical protein [Gammaproteobacteria bacterium]